MATEHVQIYADESGNTGVNLLDKSQPIFSMASTDFSDEEAAELLSLFSTQSNEVHFKNLKKYAKGQKAILELLKHPLITPERVKSVVIHKQFMVTGKIIDTLTEHYAHLCGFDLYEGGCNIALLNMMYACTPAFCGEEAFIDLLTVFIATLKDPTQQNVMVYFNTVQALKNKTTHQEFKKSLSFIAPPPEVIFDALEDFKISSIDPLVTSLFYLSMEWSKSHPNGFNIIHDDSHELMDKQSTFDPYMNQEMEPMEIGHDRRKYILPLKMGELGFGESHVHPQIQVADILASSLNYWAKGFLVEPPFDAFVQKLDDCGIRSLIGLCIWPSLDVTPQALDTDGAKGVHPVDSTAEFLIKASR